MGSNLSLKSKDSILNEPISSNELDLIKLSWEAISNKEEFGKKIFALFLAKCFNLVN